MSKRGQRHIGTLVAGLVLLSTVIAVKIHQHSSSEGESAKALPGPVDSASKATPYPGRVGKARLKAAIDACANYLVRSCDASGRFEYLVHPDQGDGQSEKYNLLRHAGAVYALVDYFERDRSASAKETIHRALEFMKREVLGPVPGQSGMAAIWSKPGLEGRKAPLEAKLGGTALGLLAATGGERIGAAVFTPEELEQLGRFILFMQKEDGSFYSKFIPERNGRNDEWTSLYYPGEAALALVTLYERDGNSTYLNASVKALGYLAKSREGRTQVEPDHWALIATGAVLKHYEGSDHPVPKQSLEAHALQVILSMMQERPHFADTSLLYGALLSDGRTTPTTTRLEGILSLLELVQRRPLAEATVFATAIDEAVAFIVRAQIAEGAYQGGIPAQVVDRGAAGDANAAEIRIDYVQHALSALLKYEKTSLAEGG